MNGKMKGNGVVAKLLFLISMNFPYYCNTIDLIIILSSSSSLLLCFLYTHVHDFVFVLLKTCSYDLCN